jgi:hypothetical protein
MRAAPTCSAAGAPEASIAIIAARYSTGGVAKARPATNAITVDPPSSWSRIHSLPDPVDLFDLSTETEASPPVAGMGSRCRAQMSAALDTASTPIAT